jgi:preprotein translocase subunit SecG
MSKNKTSNGISLTTLLLVVFIVLKLTNNIDWSWWWVASPLWIPVLFVLGVFFIILSIILLMLLSGKSIPEIKDKIPKIK